MVRIAEYVGLTLPDGDVWVPIGEGTPLYAPITTPDEPTDPDPTDPTIIAELRYSTQQDFTGHAPLNGAGTLQAIAVYLTEAGVNGADFYYTPAGGTETFVNTENTPPLAFKGDVAGYGTLFEPGVGVNKIRARVRWLDATKPETDIVAEWTHDPSIAPSDPTLSVPAIESVINGDSQVSINWTTVPGATGYRVFQDGVNVTPNGVTGTFHTLRGLVNGVTYSIRVAAYDAVGQGPLSDAALGVPMGSDTTPGDGGRFEPSATNVGFGTDGNTSVLTRTGGINVTTQGSVYENIHFTGGVDCLVDDVTFRNCLFTGGSLSGLVYSSSQTKNFVFDRCTFEIPLSGGTKADGTPKVPLGGIVTRNYTEARFCKITGCSDGIKAWHYSIYESCYINLAKAGGSKKHLDGIQGSGKTDYTVRGCTIITLMENGGNFPLFCQSFSGQDDKHVSNVLWEYNWLNGGNMHVATGDGKPVSAGGSGHGGWLHNIVIRHNRHGLDMRWAPSKLEGDVRTDNNVWDVTGTTTLGKPVTAGTLAYGS